MRIRFFIITISCGLLFLGLLTDEVRAQVENATSVVEGADQVGNEARFQIKKETYQYTSYMLKKRDPFFSIIEKAKKESKTSAEKRSPQESYDLSQMTLLGIVNDIKGAYALIVLPDAKGYTIRVGMPLGLRSGTVTEIHSDRVVVKETEIDFKGNEVTKNSFLRLRQEEE
ncbi:pilus assembly protein PilP [Nitrospirota bacterium]